MLALNRLAVKTLNIPNVANFALLICNLFVGGGFRSGNILYDSKVFDGLLVTNINSICSVEIPWQLNDINDIIKPRHVSERTDHILQVIFFDPNELATNIHQFNEMFAFYRIFAFSSTSNAIKMKHHLPIIEHLNPYYNSSSLIVDYDLENRLTSVHLALDGKEITKDLDALLSQDNKSLLFDQTFGYYERMRSVAINYPMLFRGRDDFINYEKRIPNMGYGYHANYFFASLNAKYINLTCTIYNDTSQPEVQVLAQKKRRFYKELSLEYEPIANE